MLYSSLSVLDFVIPLWCCVHNFVMYTTELCDAVYLTLWCWLDRLVMYHIWLCDVPYMRLQWLMVNFVMLEYTDLWSLLYALTFTHQLFIFQPDLLQSTVWLFYDLFYIHQYVNTLFLTDFLYSDFIHVSSLDSPLWSFSIIFCMLWLCTCPAHTQSTKAGPMEPALNYYVWRGRRVQLSWTNL